MMVRCVKFMLGRGVSIKVKTTTFGLPLLRKEFYQNIGDYEPLRTYTRERGGFLRVAVFSCSSKGIKFTPASNFARVSISTIVDSLLADPTNIYIE